jgi:hypothetical protein
MNLRSFLKRTLPTCFAQINAANYGFDGTVTVLFSRDEERALDKRFPPMSHTIRAGTA